MVINEKKVTIISIYRSPNSCVTDFIENFDMFMQSLDGSDYSIVVGDININICNGNDEYVNCYLEILSECGYVSQINKYTRE